MAGTGRGPRVTVELSNGGLFGLGRKDGTVSVKLTTAAYFGLRATRVVRTSSNGRRYRVRGEKGGKKIKVVLFDGSVNPPANGESADKITTIQIPIPADFTIDDAIAAVQQFPRNKPVIIVSNDGRWYSVDGTSGSGGGGGLPGLPGSPFLPGGNLGTIGDILGGGPQGGVLQLPGG